MFYLLLMIYMSGELEVDLNAPIDPSYWSIGENPEKGIYDAVVIKDESAIMNIRVKRYRLVRIFSEQGKAAADFMDETGTAKNLVGRVIDRSGQETRFDQEEDLVEVLDFKSTGQKQYTRMIIPPGLSSDCIVEYSWEIRADGGIPGMNSFFEQIDIPEPFYCMEKSINITSSASRASGDYFKSRFFWSGIKEPAKFDLSKSGGRGKLLKYSNIPPMEEYPYGAPNYDANAAYLICFKTFPDFGKKPEVFYKAFCRQYLKSVFETVFVKSSEYDSFLERVKATCPKTLEGMVNFHNQFTKTFACERMIPPHLKGQLKKNNGDKSDLKDQVLELLETKIGTNYAIAILYYRFLKDLDFPINFCFTTATWQPGFQPNALNPFSLRLTQPLFYWVHTNGNKVWFSPHFQEYDAGYLPSFLQGGACLIVHPQDKWSFEIQTIPRYGYQAHSRATNYFMTIDHKDQVKMKVTRDTSGNYQAYTMRHYYPLPESERNNDLKDRWQRRLRSWDVTDAKIDNVQDRTKPIKIEVNANCQLDTGDQDLIALVPFPGSSSILDSYNVWPDNRTQPIVLDFASINIDYCEIHVPADWKLKGQPSWEKKNGFGAIKVQAQQQGNVIRMRRDITIAKDISGPEGERELKFLIAWLDEAQNQSIAIQKGGLK